MSSFDAAERFRSRTMTTTCTIGTDPELDKAVQDAVTRLSGLTAETPRRSLSDSPVAPELIEQARQDVEIAIAARDASGLVVHLKSRGQHAYVDEVNAARVKDLSLGHAQYEVARKSFVSVTTPDGVDTGITWDDLDQSTTGPEMDAIAAAAVALYRSADVSPFERRGTNSART